MTWQWTPYAIPLIVMALLSTIVAIYVLWKRRDLPASRVTVLLLAGASVWLFGSAMQTASIGLQAKILWEKVQSLGMYIIPTAWLAYVLLYTGRERWLNLRNSILLCVVPIVAFLLAVTNEAHHLIWRDFWLDTSGPYVIEHAPYGVGAWLYMSYAYVLVLIGILLFLRTLARDGRLYRWQSGLVLVAVLAPWLTNIVDQTVVLPLGRAVELTPLALGLTLPLVAWSFYRLQVRDIVPVARDTVVEGMADALFVLDRENRVVDLNPAAQRLFEHSRPRALGQPLEALWPQWQCDLGDAARAGHEVSLTQKEEQRVYDVHTFPLTDWRGQLLSQVIVLHDVTERVKGETRVKASLREKEILLQTSAAVTSSLDLGQVLLALAKQLTELSGFHSCTIFQWDPEAEEIHAIVEHSHTVWLPYGAESYRLSDYPTTEHVLVSGEPEIVYMDMDDPEISWMRQIGTPAVLMLPLSSGQETIGLAEIGDFADPSAIDGVTIQACQQLLEEAASWLASPLPANPQAALLALTSRLAEVSNGSWCALSLWDKLGGELRTATEYRSSAWQPGKGPTYTLSGTIYARVLAERTPAIVRWSDPALSPQDRAQLAKWKLSMLVVQPLFVKGEPVGLIELFHATKEPVVGDEELRLWRAVADQAAVAIENARLYAVERERTDELVHTGEQLQQELAVRKRAEEQIRRYADELTRSNQELQQFAYIASHDLQEPLRMVTSYLQLLERRYHGQLDADADEFIQFAVDGAQRMHELIRDLLAYSRVGTLGGPFVPVDCERVFGQVLDNLKVAIRESEATVTCDPLPAVMADPIQLGQLFQNLIGNAIKFRGQRSPEIHVSATRHDGDWLISVRDNGIGIEAQYAERIFVIFQRLHTREEYPGTGIGLAVCKRIVERHGGRIWVESQPGQGATFSFTIPSANMTADGQKGA